jgi:hypothetical protein
MPLTLLNYYAWKSRLGVIRKSRSLKPAPSVAAMNLRLSCSALDMDKSEAATIMLLT